MHLRSLLVSFLLILLGIQYSTAQVDLNNGLIAHYDFNGDVDDKSDNSNHATVVGAYLTKDRFENCDFAYQFDSSPNLVAVPGKVLNGAQSFSVSLWVKTSKSGVVVTAANNLRHNEFFIQILSAGNIGTTVRANPSRTGQRLDGSKVVTDDKWHHIVVTRDATSGFMSVFVDSELDVSSDKVTAGNALPKLALQVPDNGLYLGADQDCVGGCWDASQQLRGVIDDVRFFGRVISNEEIKELFQVDESNAGPNLELEANINACNDSYVLDAGSGFDSYLWSTGETTQKITIRNSGNYSVTAKINSCDYSGTTNVDFIQNPELKVEVSDNVVRCVSYSITLSASTGFDNYRWSNGHSGRVISVNEAGEYLVRADGPCGETVSDLITIGSSERLQLRVISSNSEVNCFEEPVLIEANEGFTSYQWSNGSHDRAIEVSSSGIYSVSAVDDCGVAQELEITIGEKTPDFFIPNAITPNDDGKNDSFEIDAGLVGSQITITNRWGKQVYSSGNYQNEWGAADLPDGVYYYRIQNTCLSQPLKGWIKVVR